MDNYIISLENKNGDYISLEGVLIKGVDFPEFPLGEEKIILHNSPSLIENYKKRSSLEELQKRFSERAYIIKNIKFEKEKILINAIEE